MANTTIYRPEEERKIDRVKALKEERSILLSQNYRNKIRLREIKDDLDRVCEEEIKVTDHAVKRFQERIMNVPSKTARRILSDKSLLKRYKDHGPGPYIVDGYPNVLAVVHNLTVVTCYNKYDPLKKLEDLEKYMEYFIRERHHQIINGFDYKIDSFSKFRRLMYR